MSTSKKKGKKKSVHHEGMSNIMKEISQLKQELTTIKSRKQLQTIKNLPENIINRVCVKLHEINFKDKEKRLKTSIEINKLKKIVERSKDSQLLSSQINVVLSIFNLHLNAQQQKMDKIEQQLSRMYGELDEVNNEKMNQDQIRKKNKKLKLQINDLRHYACLYAELLRDNKQEVKRYVKESEDLEQYNKQLEKNNQTLRKQIQMLNSQKNDLNQRINELSADLLRKQQQLLGMKEDTNFYKTQLDRIKENKKTLQHKLQSEERNFEKEQTQKAKVIKNLELRIQQLEEELKQTKYIISEYHQLKLEHNKISIQLREAENNFMVKSVQSQKLKVKVTELEDINLKCTEQISTLQQQNEELQKNLTFCQQEIENLSEEVNELKISNERYKNQFFKNKMKLVKDQENPKSKTLAEIKDLIKRHRNDEDDD